MRWGILGGGFGLYGYLPAFLALSFDATLPRRYRETMDARDDLRPYIDAVHWVDHDQDLLNTCNALVIAKPPVFQAEWIEQILYTDNITHVLLEKPLCATPHEARNIHDRLVNSGKAFDVGYLFRHTDWGRTVLEDNQAPSALQWRFNAHHYRHDLSNWKSDHALGGGALRFYGIHLIALLAELGIDAVTSSRMIPDSKGGIASWEATFDKSSLMVSSHDQDTKFTIDDTHFIDPFASTNNDNTESRIAILKRYITSFLEEGQDSRSKRLYDVIDLWTKTEAVTKL